ncbi:adenylate/guanylate cyclase domain-containing protein [Inquilinus limosus]|uniref:adenylate/guanylate cyclase domain-containing protein n=1 Tax=Inquilinus limosus TaxID=171674 RepID=UPI0004260D41|nr:adenylate/guanylate cyclase domain-containing protein [Inquilinus limosus]
MRGLVAAGLGPWKLQAVVAAVFAVIVLAIAGGLIWYNNGEVRRLVRADASARFDRVVERVRGEFQDGLHLAQVVLDTSTLTIETDVPKDHLSVVVGGTLRDLEKVLPAATSFFVAWNDGRFVLAESLATARLPDMKAAALPGAAYVLEFVDRRSNGATARWVVTDARGSPLGEPQTAPTDFDPRTRPWYEQAFATTGAVVTEPYRFANMNQVGLTLARKSRLAGDVVFGIDIGLASVDHTLADLRRQHGLDLVVFSRSGELIAHPDGVRFRTEFREARAEHLPRMTELGSPILAEMYRSFQAVGTGRNFTGQLGDESYLERFELIAANMPDIVLGIAYPYDLVVGPADRIRFISLLIGVGATILALGIVMVAARALARPLRRVTAELGQIMRFDFHGGGSARSRIEEIRSLAAAIGVLGLTLRTFAAYVPGQIVRGIVAQKLVPALGGRRQPITVLFSDVEGFTALAEGLAPEELMERTSRYFSALGEELIASGATIDKYIGDSVMAFWNAPEPQPDHVRRACIGALNAAARIDKLNAEFEAEGSRPMPTRFGLHTGDAVVGNVGSVDRMNYTALGHTVNVAARLEALNKIHGTTILVSDAVRLEAGEAFEFRFVGNEVPRGAREPVPIYALVGLREGAEP